MFSSLALTLLPAIALIAQQPVNQPVYQIHRDVIRGRVTTDSGLAIAGAPVAVTMAPDRQTQFDTTDGDGRYEIVWEKGTGDYLVHVAVTGRVTFRKRITRVGSDSVLTVDVAMRPTQVQQLAPVVVRATRSRPARDDGLNFRTPSMGGAEQSPSGMFGAVAPDLAGNLDAVASTLPGITAVPGGGISVLGGSPSQNATTLNGLNFAGGGVPRGASTTVRISSSTYDPARGGYSGGLTQVSLAAGNITTYKRAYVTLDAPPLQSVDAVGRRAGAQYTSIDLNVGSDGATNMDRWMYNGGLQYRRRFSDVVSLLSADEDVLQRSGVARDSVQRLLSTLTALGVPVTGSAPSSRVTDYLSFMGRIDRPLFDYNTFTPLNTSWGVIGYANVNRTGALSLAPTVTPGHGGENQHLNAGAQYLYSRYFGKLKDQLTELRSGISLAQSSNDPYLRLPDGRVLTSSTFGDGSTGVASLGFAGNSALESSTRNITWQTASETQFFWRGRAAHRGKVFAESRIDRFSQETPANRLGTLSFNSLADLAGNQPASFSRTLATPARKGGEWGGALGVSDMWRKTDRLSFLYGARVEVNAFLDAPAYNPAVETAFAARTDHAPNGWHLSPRFGFNWLTSRTSRRAGTAGYGSSMGTFSSMGRGVLRGGFGEFRQYLEPTLLAEASASTGLPTGSQRINCVGPAVPTPNWSMWLSDETAIPTSCVGATTAAGFVDAAPGVQLFDRNYQPSRSWRGNVQWASAFKQLLYTIDVIYSLNRNQPSTMGLNFLGTPAFSLAEGGRPVFVPESSIVASTGAVASAASRRTAAFGPVMSRRSDLNGWARQIMVRGRPGTGFIGGRWLIDGTYTFTETHAQSRGFDGATFGDPRVIEWSRADYSPRHEVFMQAGLQTKWVVVTTSNKFSSGLPYTPLVGSDINGDGLANDRAFVFPTTDPVLASATRQLLGSTTGQARDCLQRQMGRAAGRNSCEGPWTTTMALTIGPTFTLLNKLKMRRHRVWLNIANPLAGLDQLLHGSNPRGWGTQPIPDRVLYFVRGYDSTANRFRYEVNPRFGDTRARANALRAPFRITMDVTLDFSRNSEAQQLDRILNPGRRGNPGTRLDEAAIVKRYCGNLPNWYNEILQLTDSLLLTRDQVDALRQAQGDYAARIMEHWRAWSREMAGQPDRFNSEALLKRQNTVINDAWELARQEARASLPKILSPLQLGMLPGNANTLYTAKEPITGIRYFSTAAC